MNYPIWSLPNPGLLIAFVAIVHVFISHFAVGGGFFLVLAERKARREGDTGLLGFVRQHGRFFILLTLVLGAITGVGIWFTIGLVHPQATSALIRIFVWAWAIEWTFFVTEIAAAMVYYYGWDRLDARTHERVGWIYAVSAWLSLAVINGILSFMLTPGGWLATGSVWAGLFNPSYWPSLVARTCTAFGLAGLYALLTAARLSDPLLKEKVTRYAARWVYLMSVALPIAVVWFLWVAEGAGVQVGEVLGVKALSPGGLAAVLLGGSASGYPPAIVAARSVLAGSAITLLVTLFIARFRPRSYGLGSAVLPVLFAFVAMGAGEWVREDLRKPYVIGRYMFVNGVRIPPEWAADATGASRPADRFGLPEVRRSGILQAALWTRLAPSRPGEDALHRREAEGREVFRLACSQCHSMNGYLAIRPLVAARQQEALAATIGRFTSGDRAPADGTTLWTWRGRRMPPFAGTDAERDALSVYLARLGGSVPHLPVSPAAGDAREGRPAITPGVPLLDPLPLPAPAWLLSALLSLTFTLHVVPMNLLLGGSLIAVLACVRGRRDKNAAALAGVIAKALPVVFAAAVSIGVAALLFLQALYGRVFFPGAVLLAVPWILSVPLIVAAYYGAYWEEKGARSPAVALLVALPVVAAAFVQANVMGLLLRPETFRAMFFADASGLRLNLGDPTVVPRFLHVVVGALAVSGLAISVAGFLLRRREPELGPWMVQQGVFWAAGATIVNILPGFWWLAALPSGMLLRFMGRDLASTLWLAGGVLAALAALGHLIPVVMVKNPRSLLAGAVGSLLAAVVCMVAVRDTVRRVSLGAATLPPADWLAPQWSAIAAFGALLVVATVTVVWMVHSLVEAKGSGS